MPPTAGALLLGALITAIALAYRTRTARPGSPASSGPCRGDLTYHPSADAAGHPAIRGLRVACGAWERFPGGRHQLMRHLRHSLACIVLAAAFGVLAFTGAPAALAATPACQAVPGSVCHSWQTPAAGGLDLDALGTSARPDTPLIVYTATGTDKAEDFLTVPVGHGLPDVYGAANTSPDAGTTLVEIEYAPLGQASGECASTIDPVAGQAAELRPCDTLAGTYNPFQVFIEASATGDGSFVTFQDVSPDVPAEASPAAALDLYLSDPRSVGAGKAGHRTQVESEPESSGVFPEGQLWASAP